MDQRLRSKSQRQYRDPDAPEVAYVADQVAELERQIQDEREKAVGSGGRDLNKLVNQSERLEADVTFARDALASAMRAADNSRMESQRQLKFIVMLSKPMMPQALIIHGVGRRLSHVLES